MMRHARCWRAASPVLLAGLAWSLTGCSLPGTVNSSAAQTRASRSAASATGPLKSATGTWIYQDRYTQERLRLHQGRGGVVTGDGHAAVADAKIKHKLDESAIEVHRGYLSKGKLTLSLYITPVNWGSTETVVEYLACKATTRVLHCRMNLPLFQHVSNIPQDFYRHA